MNIPASHKWRGSTFFSKGFTLAEVLITLGIIGVVAAMTLPALIQNYQKNVLMSQLKANVSLIERALAEIAEEAGGSLAYTSFGRSIEGSATYNGSYFAPFYRDYLKKHMHVTRAVCGSRYLEDCPQGRLSENNYRWLISQAGSGSKYWSENAVELSNGAYVGFYINGPNNNATGGIDIRNYHCGATPYAHLSSMKTICGVIEIDVNGEKNPNQNGMDLFVFYFDEHGHLFPYGSEAHTMAFSGAKQAGYWKHEKTLCCTKKDSGCGWSQGFGCAGRVVENGWKIDYF